MNNRQANNGRRRGRGGQQRQGGNPSQGNGNRIDNRARGNAAQLLEKYKNLARDAQMQGDRVNAEYYLQFADHYFRVLSESRSRFEEQNPNQRQPRPSNDIDGDDEDFEFEAEGNRGDESRDDRPQQREPRYEREPRQDREARRDREDREPRQDREFRQEREPRQDREPREGRDRDGRRDRRPNGNANGYANGHPAEAQEAPAPELFAEQRDEERPVRAARGRGRPRREAVEVEAPQGIDAAILPPAFGTEASAANDADETPKKPRRRRTKTDEAEVPPAA